MTRRVFAGVAASLVALVVLGSPVHERSRFASCADRLHITWTAQDGATERLVAFRACVAGGAR